MWDFFNADRQLACMGACAQQRFFAVALNGTTGGACPALWISPLFHRNCPQGCPLTPVPESGKEPFQAELCTAQLISKLLNVFANQQLAISLQRSAQVVHKDIQALWGEPEEMGVLPKYQAYRGQ